MVIDALALCRHPDQQRHLRETRELIPKAIEERLRYDPPVQMMVRMDTTTNAVGETEIPAGRLSFLSWLRLTVTQRNSRSRIAWTLAASPTTMVHLEGEFTSAWVHRWRVWRARAQSMLEKFPHLQSANPEDKLEYRGSTALRGLSKLLLSVR